MHIYCKQMFCKTLQTFLQTFYIYMITVFSKMSSNFQPNGQFSFLKLLNDEEDLSGFVCVENSQSTPIINSKSDL